VPGDRDVLSLTLNEDLAVINVSKNDRNGNRTSRRTDGYILYIGHAVAGGDQGGSGVDAAYRARISRRDR
jgi:hypothetical protein